MKKNNYELVQMLTETNEFVEKYKLGLICYSAFVAVAVYMILNMMFNIILK